MHTHEEHKWREFPDETTAEKFNRQYYCDCGAIRIDYPNHDAGANKDVMSVYFPSTKGNGGTDG